MTTYGDISPAVAASSSVMMLKRAHPLLIIQQFGQAVPLQKGQTETKLFRRYEALSTVENTPLTEGVTPSGSALTKTDYTATLLQYGDYIEFTDKMEDMHTDPYLQEFSDMCGKQAAQTIEKVAFGVVKAGTSVYRANGSARTDINTPLTIGLQRKAVRSLKRQNAMPITQLVKHTTDYGTEAVPPCFVALVHVDLETTVRGLPNFKDVVDYAGGKSFPGEIGSCEGVRYVASTVITAWADAGGAYAGSGTAMISTTGTSADVYPVIYLGADAFGCVSLKGANAITPSVLRPNTPRGGDPIGQRGTIGWKTYFVAVILNQAWMVRVEVAVPELA